MIGAIEIRLIAAGAVDAGPRVIRHDQLGGAVEELEGGNVAVDPVRQILAPGGLREGVGAGAEHGDEERSRRDIAGLAIVDRHRGAGPVDEHLLAGLCVLPEHDVVIPVPPLIQLAETAVAVAVRLRFAILFPEQLQGHMFVTFELAMDFGEVQARPRVAEAGIRGRVGNSSSLSRRSSQSSGNGQVRPAAAALSRYR